MEMIHIVDYGMGNLGSIANMLKKIGCESAITSDPRAIGGARKLILPGIGSFDHGMRSLKERELIPVLDRKVKEERVPVLGICLGMQLFAKQSSEGGLPGLGWIDSECRRFEFPESRETRLRVPHMGWNVIHVKQKQAFIPDDGREWRFYFVHSFYIDCRNESDVLCTTTYGLDFASGVRRDNILGVQFHPEKSHRFGMALLKNFAES